LFRAQSDRKSLQVRRLRRASHSVSESQLRSRLCDVLEHGLDERGFLGELARVSRQFVYVEVPCEVHWRTTFDSLQKTLKQSGHINAYTPETFGLTLETSGLQVAQLELFDHDLALYRFESSFLRGAEKHAPKIDTRDQPDDRG
jgi:hypothetical protein